MTEQPPVASPAAPETGPSRALVWSAVAMAFVAIAILGYRTLAAEDLGYHLAYGEQLWQTGKPVDHSPEVYLQPPPGLPAEQRPEPGPGCWYDDQGRYRFPNANWGTQAILAAVYRAGGIPALGAFRAALIVGLFALMAGAMARLGLRGAGMAAGLLLVAWVSYPRFYLRPELLGGVVLAAQAWRLAGMIGMGERASGSPPWRSIVDLVALQLLFVNLHGYFLLGIAVTGAVWTGMLVSGRAGRTEGPPLLRRRLTMALVAQILICFVNPWTWRLAILPVQTLAFLRRHHLTSGPGDHPWSAMADLQRTALFSDGWTTEFAAIGRIVFFGVAAVGLVVLARQRRWEWLLAAGGMLAVSFSAERNVMAGAIVAGPLAMAGLRAALVGAGPAMLRGAPARTALAVVTVLFAGAVAWGAGTDRLYRRGQVSYRFGAGVARKAVPLGVADWLTRQEVTGRIWCRLASTSNVFFFTEPRPRINLLTNTWAYPPDALRIVSDISSDTDVGRFLAALRQWDVSVLIMGNHPHLKTIRESEDWVVGQVRDGLAVLIRRNGADARLAAAARVPSPAEVAAWVNAIRTRDRWPAAALIEEGSLCVVAGWVKPAIHLLEAATRADPTRADAWFFLGLQHWLHGLELRDAEAPGVGNHLRQAEAALLESARLRPRPATMNLLRQVREQPDATGR